VNKMLKLFTISTQFEEHLFCEVVTGHNEKILIGSLYKSPSGTDNNFEQLCKIYKESTKLQSVSNGFYEFKVYTVFITLCTTCSPINIWKI
jgi:hypothetical protein